MSVDDLSTALDAYWSAHSRREEQAAYHEILLFGGPDGYRLSPKPAVWIVRRLRMLAYWIEQKWT